jgi:class 3 adenylate cyclase
MPEGPRTAIIRYVFVDVVGFTLNRTIEAQSKIIATLIRVMRETVDRCCGSYLSAPGAKVIYLHAGDGACICLVNLLEPFDNHITLALQILEGLHAINKAESQEMCRFDVRIGINENQDNLIVDINDQPGVAGAGVNMAQRVMSQAGGSQIFVGQSVFERLNQRDAYHGGFRLRETVVKHGLKLACYQYIGTKPLPYLDQRLSQRPPAAARLPLGVAVYHALLGLFTTSIDQHRSTVATVDSLVVLLCSITQDYLDHESSNDLQRRIRRSRIPLVEHGTLAAALSSIDASPPLVIYAARCHLIGELDLQTWSHLFHKDKLARHRTSLAAVQRQWTWLPGHIRSHLQRTAPLLAQDCEPL